METVSIAPSFSSFCWDDGESSKMKRLMQNTAAITTNTAMITPNTSGPLPFPPPEEVRREDEATAADP